MDTLQHSTREYQNLDANYHIHAFLDQKKLNAERLKSLG